MSGRRTSAQRIGPTRGPPAPPHGVGTPFAPDRRGANIRSRRSAPGSGRPRGVTRAEALGAGATTVITETSRRQVSEQRRGALAVQIEWPHVFQKPWAIPDVRRGHPGAWSCAPARSRRADGQRHQSSAPAHAGARGSSPAWLQAHTQSDFGTVGATKHGHRQQPAREPGMLRAPRGFAAGCCVSYRCWWSTSATPPQGP